MTSRSVARVVPGLETLEGADFPVRRPFPTSDLDFVDPFLLLDEMGPVDVAPGEAKGAPDHPHRGFETVTYMLSGRMEHHDSHGNSGVIDPGDVQWMTAGGGVIHSELPEREFFRAGGRMHGFQLWVNLPASDKRMAPRYQEIPAARIPTVSTDDGRVLVRVIAGEALGAGAVIETRTPILYLDIQLAPGAGFSPAVPREYNGFVYVVEGEIAVGSKGRPVKRGELAVLTREGDDVSLRTSPATAARVLLVGGAPIGEPVARYGPFVMNTRREILEAIEDLQHGRFVASSEGTLRT